MNQTVAEYELYLAMLGLSKKRDHIDLDEIMEMAGYQAENREEAYFKIREMFDFNCQAALDIPPGDGTECDLVLRRGFDFTHRAIEKLLSEVDAKGNEGWLYCAACTGFSQREGKYYNHVAIGFVGDNINKRLEQKHSGCSRIESVLWAKKFTSRAEREKLAGELETFMTSSFQTSTHPDYFLIPMHHPLKFLRTTLRTKFGNTELPEGWLKKCEGAAEKRHAKILKQPWYLETI